MKNSTLNPVDTLQTKVLKMAADIGLKVTIRQTNGGNYRANTTYYLSDKDVNIHNSRSNGIMHTLSMAQARNSGKTKRCERYAILSELENVIGGLIVVYGQYGSIRVPKQCLLDCSCGGSVDIIVSDWVQDDLVTIDYTSESMIEEVESYAIDDVTSMSNPVLKGYILWLLACNWADESDNIED